MITGRISLIAALALGFCVVASYAAPPQAPVKATEPAQAAPAATPAAGTDAAPVNPAGSTPARPTAVPANQGPRGLPHGPGPTPGEKNDTIFYWQAGKPIGWTVSLSNGMQTHFDKSPDGEVVRYLKNDPKQAVTMRLTFAKGNKTHAVLYQKAGVKSMEMDLKGDVQHGIWKSFHGNGQLRDSCRKEEGLVQGNLISFDDKGRRIRLERYKDGKQEGITEAYYAEGPKQSENGFKGGMRDGQYTAWAVNGSLVTRGQYAMGVPSGTWEEFYPNGQVRARTRLADWHILERKCFHPEGRPVACTDDAEEATALAGMRRKWESERARLSGKRPRMAPPPGPKPVAPPKPPVGGPPPLPDRPPADRVGP